MAYRYIVFELVYYASEYTKQTDNTPRRVVWEDYYDEEKRREASPNQWIKEHDKD